ncbi:MAG TPA: hypothetical protein VF622_05905 [Segetibacter sp.]|jgi:hypothetical protein
MSDFRKLKRIENNKRYLDEFLQVADNLIHDQQFNSAATLLKDLAEFAFKNCTGYYINWKLEALLSNLGCVIPQESYAPTVNGRTLTLNILHVASELYATGGHTKLLLNWINNDQGNFHSIIVTRQESHCVPEEIIKNYGHIIESLDPSKSILQNASELRRKAIKYDFIVLHIHPDDIVPVIAFNSNDLPPVAFLNHADHCFWTGGSVIDTLIQIREPNIALDTVRRKLDSQFFLPIPVDADKNNKAEYYRFRNELGIPDNKLVLLTTGHQYKYTPNKEYNFFEATIEVLNRNENYTLFVAGVYADSELAKKYRHAQINYLGDVKDLYRYEIACDIYLEGFPFPSFTAMLQAGLRGKVIHLMYNPVPAIRFFDEQNSNIFYYSKTKSEWIDALLRLLINGDYKKKVQISQFTYLEKHYTRGAWSTKLDFLYKTLFNSRHYVKSEPSSNCYLDKNEIFLSHFDANTVINAGEYRASIPMTLYVFHLGLLFKRELSKAPKKVLNKSRMLLKRNKSVSV